MAALGLGATMLPLLAASPAAAVSGPQPAPTVTPNPVATNATNFTLSNGTCDGTGGAGWRVQTYILNVGVDPLTLAFDQGVGSSQVGTDQNASDGTIQAPLYKGNAPGTGYNPAASPAGLINPADLAGFNFSAASWTLTDGAYQIGYACINELGVPMQSWSQTVTIDAAPTAGNFMVVGSAPGAPTGVNATAQSQQCTVSFTPPSGSVSNYTVTATPAAGAPVTQTGPSSPIVVGGLTNNTAYSITVTATNAAGTSAASSPPVSCTPVGSLNPPTNVQVSVASVSGPDSATVTWTAPAPNSPPENPANYTVAVTGPTPSTQTVAFGTNTASITNLAQGAYSVVVTANYSGGNTRAAAPQTFTVNPDGTLFQNIDVTRPVGALVLTQVCNSHAAFPANSLPTGTPVGFPNGMPAVPPLDPSIVGSPTAGGLAPTTVEDGARPTTSDPVRADYPYPTDVNGVPTPTYPTHCGLDLGPARFINRGPGAGQFFAATGVINQVTVVDTRDAAPTVTDWTATGQATQFVSETDANDVFSAKQLGWTPVVSSFTQPFPDGNGGTYTPNPVAGPNVDPNSTVANTSALDIARTLASADDGLGTTVLDARVRVLIPVTADAGRYESTLTITTA